MRRLSAYRWPVALLLLAGCKDRYRERPAKPPTQPVAKPAEPKPQPEPEPEVSAVETEEMPRVAAERDDLNALAKEIGARTTPIEIPCLEGEREDCYRWALDRIFSKLDVLVENKEQHVRVIQLGDSHIAADYITRTARARLQEKFGDGGRGFVVPDQRAPFGGRRVRRKGRWRRMRIVDRGQKNKPMGFSGMTLHALRQGAFIEYYAKSEEVMNLYYLSHPRGGLFDVGLKHGPRLGRLSTRGNRLRSKVKRFRIKRKESEEEPIVRIKAKRPGGTIVGVSFLHEEPGFVYDSIGPVGADARVYLELNARSFTEHIRYAAPDLVILMLGGNDALRVRQGRATLEEIRSDFTRLIARLRKSLPKADCMLWAPMDAGDRTEEGEIVSKPFIHEVRVLQHEVAIEQGCAFWDLYASMGGEGSLARWHDAGIMNDDLVHPRSKAGEILGEMFATSFLKAYEDQD